MEINLHTQPVQHPGSIEKFALLFFADPLNHGETRNTRSTSSTNLTASHPQRSNIIPPRSAKIWESSVELQDGCESSRPFFKPRHQARTVELFFDLFFVANLTVFSIDHEIDDGSSKEFLCSLLSQSFRATFAAGPFIRIPLGGYRPHESRPRSKAYTLRQLFDLTSASSAFSGLHGSK